MLSAVLAIVNLSVRLTVCHTLVSPYQAKTT